MRRSVEAYVGSRGDIAEYNRSQAYAYTTKAEAFPAAVMTISGVPLVLIPGGISRRCGWGCSPVKMTGPSLRGLLGLLEPWRGFTPCA